MKRLWDECRTLVQALAVGGLLGLPARVAAQVTLEWDAPAECPSREAVTAQVTRLLAGSTAARTAQPVSARATVRKLAAGYLLELATDVGGEHGERTLQAPSCAELAAASAVIVALLVDPAAVSAPASSASEAGSAASGGSPGTTGHSAGSIDGGDDDGSESDPAGARSGEADEAREAPTKADDDAADDDDVGDGGGGDDELDEPDDEPASGSAAPTQVRLRPELVLDLGTMPRFSAGPGLALGLQLGAVAIEASASYSPLQRVQRGGRAVAELEHASAALAACHALPPLPVVSPCVRVHYGRLWGRGLSVRTPQPGGGALVAGELSLRATLPFGARFAVVAETGLALPLVAPLFTVAGVGVIHEPATVLVRLRAGLEVRL